MSVAAQWLQPLSAAWVDTALAGGIGTAVIRGAVPPPVAASLFRYSRWIIALLGIGLAAYFSASTVAMTDTDAAGFPGAAWLVLTRSDYGAMVWVALAAWIILAAAVGPRAARATPRSRYGLLYIPGLIAFSYARAATGHAADDGFFSAAVLVHTIHILSAGAWAGSVGICALSIPTWHTWSTRQRGALAHRLSKMATIAVPTVVATGLVNAVRTLGPSAHPWDTTYTKILATKVALAVVAVALGSWDRWSWMKRLDKGEDAGARGFRSVLIVEAIVLVAVLILAARLGTTMLPR
ncbi:MAG: hypothetical protein EPN41_09850 [Candidimonas sp.]|nr:MAG: hypothetical protein EPN41_09850 [Candidimonas sp.]